MERCGHIGKRLTSPDFRPERKRFPRGKSFFLLRRGGRRRARRSRAADGLLLAVRRRRTPGAGPGDVRQGREPPQNDAGPDRASRGAGHRDPRRARLCALPQGRAGAALRPAGPATGVVRRHGAAGKIPPQVCPPGQAAQAEGRFRARRMAHAGGHARAALVAAPRGGNLRPDRGAQLSRTGREHPIPDPGRLRRRRRAPCVRRRRNPRANPAARARDQRPRRTRALLLPASRAPTARGRPPLDGPRPETRRAVRPQPAAAGPARRRNGL